MDRNDFLLCLNDLHLAPKEAAELLGYEYRTIKRWQERNAVVPPAAAEVLKAWRRLHLLGLPWRPGTTPIGLTDAEAAEQLRLHREHAVKLEQALSAVRMRGGPASPWKVDLTTQMAELGDIQLYFYRLENGGFSISSYSRSDKEPDIDRDWPLLEDAIACIADAIAAERKDRTQTEIISHEHAVANGIYKQHRVLVADMERVTNRPGWVSVEAEAWDASGDEGDHLVQRALRPQPGQMLEKYVKDALRKRARQMGIKYIILKQ